MFDGYQPAAPGSPPPPRRPHPIDTCAMLPMLRVQASAVAVEYLAGAAAFNAVEAARWAATSPLREGLDSPTWKMAEALDALAIACDRHRSLTGCDGLALAGSVIARDFGTTLAGYVLAPLAVIQGAGELFIPQDEATPAPPTAAERAAATDMVLGLIFSNEHLGDLGTCLEALRQAAAADEGEPGLATLATLNRARQVLQDAAERGLTGADLQWVLDMWANATGGPRVTVHGIPES